MSGFEVNHELLLLACRRLGFAVPGNGLVFFGIRGAVPVAGLMGEFGARHSLEFAQIDYLQMNCTIGQWKPADGVLAVHLASTVPSLPNIARARKAGGAGANLLLPGQYGHVKGIHKANKPSGHRAFRQASFCPVRRTRDNTSYDTFDRIDFGQSPTDFVWDNIHCAYSSTRDSYSSAGCQVICGAPGSPPGNPVAETGPWGRFVATAYSDFSGQDRFCYFLFTAADMAEIATTGPARLSQIVRYGSAGPAARLAQDALIAKGLLQGPAADTFGRDALRALVQFQTANLPVDQVDGECGPTTAAALGITLPGLIEAIAPSVVEPISATPPSSSESDDETDMTPDQTRNWLASVGAAPLRPVAGQDQAQVVAAVPAVAPASAQTVPTQQVPDGTPSVQAQLDRILAEFPQLTPINAALGTTIGRLLDGNKTIIGIVGSVLTVIGERGGTLVEPFTNAIDTTFPALAGTAAVWQPLFFAMTVWGALGKVEKRLVQGVPTAVPNPQTTSGT